MDRAVALARLKLYSAWDSDPAISDADMGTILDLYALEDAAGLPPTDLAWAGAWDIRAAARKAWEIKAGKVVSDVDYDADGSKYTASQLHAHCLAMADRFADQGTSSIEGVGGPQ